MTPLVDIIDNVIDSMKPTFNTSADVDGQVVTFTNDKQVTHKMFVGERIKVKDGTGAEWHYGKVTAIIDSFEFVVTFTDLEDDEIGTPEAVINYHYGTDEEMIQRFTDITLNGAVKREQFPIIYLSMSPPIEEGVKNDGYRASVSVNLLFLTDSRREWSTPDRYTYSYKPILYPLVDLFFDQLSLSKELSPEIQEYDRTDHVSFGRHGVDEKKLPMFNDYLDGIEISNLKLKIFKT